LTPSQLWSLRTYIPEIFREDRVDVLRAFIAAHPLGALVATTADSSLVANYIPMMLVEREPPSRGALIGHVARANPVWQHLPSGAQVRVLFNGANHYITPSWYPDKAAHGKVVPTWNYSVVQARGVIRFDSRQDQSDAHVSALTDHQESSREAPWKVTDAPADYIAQPVRHTVAFEIELTELVGKFKSSQHRPQSERAELTHHLELAGVSPADRAELIRAPD
jgi:transcriptional regulator